MTQEQTERALLVLVNDLAELTAVHERVRLQIEALAKQHGVAIGEREL
jgi:hypothetical protein